MNKIREMGGDAPGYARATFRHRNTESAVFTIEGYIYIDEDLIIVYPSLTWNAKHIAIGFDLSYLVSIEPAINKSDAISRDIWIPSTFPPKIGY